VAVKSPLARRHVTHAGVCERGHDPALVALWKRVDYPDVLPFLRPVGQNMDATSPQTSAWRLSNCQVADYGYTARSKIRVRCALTLSRLRARAISL
jgi:hypothetical protein